MSFVSRGARNAFRNLLRTSSVIIILALAMGLALTMLLAHGAVESRISSIKSAIGNTIMVSPAGAQGFEGGGNLLSTSDVSTIMSVAHVTKATAVLQDRLSNQDSNSNAVTNLTSPVPAGSIGRRFGGNANFTPPIRVTGTTDPASTQVTGTNALTLTTGKMIDGSSSSNVALVGKDLAGKNNLSVGSTFSAYGQTITVSGIYDSGSTFGNAGIIMPLAAVENLTAQPGGVSSVVVQVDSISNLNATVTALQNKLGTSKADVVSQQDTAAQAVAPLESITSITFYSLIGAVLSGAVIIFLTMLMIVRERRREIGVFKAIGASNAGIVTQFISESLVLTVLGAVVGTVAGVVFSNSVVKLLVTSASSGGGRIGGPGGGFGRGLVASIHTSVGFSVLLWGLAGAVVIALVGSAIPAYVIAKIRPAEVMRGE